MFLKNRYQFLPQVLEEIWCLIRYRCNNQWRCISVIFLSHHGMYNASICEGLASVISFQIFYFNPTIPAKSWALQHDVIAHRPSSTIFLSLHQLLNYSNFYFGTNGIFPYIKCFCFVNLFNQHYTTILGTWA